MTLLTPPPPTKSLTSGALQTNINNHKVLSEYAKLQKCDLMAHWNTEASVAFLITAVAHRRLASWRSRSSLKVTLNKLSTRSNSLTLDSMKCKIHLNYTYLIKQRNSSNFLSHHQSTFGRFHSTSAALPFVQNRDLSVGGNSGSTNSFPDAIAFFFSSEYTWSL